MKPVPLIPIVSGLEQLEEEKGWGIRPAQVIWKTEVGKYQVRGAG